MGTLAIATLTASLLGSLHCVGMCGPFALWATGSDRRLTVLSSYHLGRLTTYLSAGLIGGLIGSTVTMSGEFAGFQMLSAKIAGVMLVAFGIWRLVAAVRSSSPADAELKPSKIAKWLHAAKPLIASRGPMGRAYLGGLLTTWLPCGWLYLFVLVAAGTGNVIHSLIVMAAFWGGTLPALTGIVYGANALSLRFRTAMPVLTAVVLILSGLYTATGRAAADLSTMNPEVATQVRQAGEGNVESSVDPAKIDFSSLAEEPLPCCRGEE